MTISYENVSCIARQLVVEIEAESEQDAWDELATKYDTKGFDVEVLEPATEDYYGLYEFRYEFFV